MPIWWQEDIIGTFGVAGNDPGRRFGEREIELLGNLARQAAVAIENARLYAASRDLGIVEERNRLAREIHDTLAQSLLTLTFQIRAARGSIGDDPIRADAELRTAEANARAALEEARRSVWNLGPAALETASLVEALGAEADPGRAGLPCRLVVSGAARPLAGDVQLALLRVAQEAIANARRHAQASRIEVRLEFGEEGVSLSVADDGRGFNPAALGHGPTPSGGFGLLNMAERLRHLGGSLEVHSGPGNGPGTTIVAAVLYPAAVPEPATRSGVSPRAGHIPRRRGRRPSGHPHRSGRPARRATRYGHDRAGRGR